MVENGDNAAIRFNERDFAVFRDHLPRFRLTTNEALRRVFRAGSMNVVHKWVSRRRQQGYLSTAPLPGDTGQDYHQLTERAAEQFGVEPKTAEPLRGQTFTRCYGMLSFCWLGPRLYRKLSVDEFIKAFPELVHRRLERPNNYYLDDDYRQDGRPARKRIGYLYIAPGKSDVAIRKRLRELVSQRLRLWPWKGLITDRDRFIITLVTTDDDRKWKLEMEIVSMALPAPIRVEVREDLERIIAGGPNGAS